MASSDWSDKHNFLYPRHTYQGKFTPMNFAFNDNLQEFSQAVLYISGLHTGGKLSSEEAYKQMKKLWKQLKRSQKAMRIGTEED